MIRPALFVLALGLLGGIGYEAQDWLIGSADPAMPRTGPVAGGGTGTRTVAAAPVNGLSTWRDQILSRPLFSQSRRPVETAGHSVSGLSRLTGIIMSGGRKVAIFAAPSGGAAIIVEEGGRVGVYDVRQIADTGVTVAGPDGTTVIRPNFDTATVVVKPKPRAPVPAPEARAVSGG